MEDMYNDESFDTMDREDSGYVEMDDYSGDRGGSFNRRNPIPDSSNNAGNVVSWVEKLGGFINRQGLKNTFLTIMLLFLCITVGYYAFNPMAIIEKVEVTQTKQHNESIQRRKNADQIIKSSIVEMRNILGAQRSFVFETHNGGQNLAGLPFLYVDMTYDEPVAGMKKLQDEYKNISQTRYDIMDDIYSSNFWCGPIEEVESVDKELFYRLQKEDVTYLAVLVLYGEYNIIGAIGITYNTINGNEPVVLNDTTIRREMYKYASQITNALTSVNKTK